MPRRLNSRATISLTTDLFQRKTYTCANDLNDTGGVVCGLVPERLGAIFCEYNPSFLEREIQATGYQRISTTAHCRSRWDVRTDGSYADTMESGLKLSTTDRSEVLWQADVGGTRLGQWQRPCSQELLAGEIVSRVDCGHTQLQASSFVHHGGIKLQSELEITTDPRSHSALRSHSTSSS